MYDLLFKLIPSNKRDNEGDFATKGFKGLSNKFKTYLRLQLAKIQYRNLK